MIPLVQWKKLEDQLKTETLKIWKSNSPKIAKTDFVHPLSKGENF